MRLSSAGLAIMLIAAGSLLAWAPNIGVDTHALLGADFAPALAAAAELLLMLLSAWILACVALLTLATRVSSLFRLAHALTPAFLRRALFLGAAGALAIGPVSASSGTGQHSTADSGHATAQILDGLRLPDRPTASAPHPVRATPPGAAKPGTVTVRAGDSLWSIAARELGGDARNSDIAAASRRWYAANRKQIGTDANLIFPGQKLTPPTKDIG